eukprot:gene66884-91597_t
MQPADFSFGKEKHLKSRKQIDQLFAGGKAFFVHPIKVFWQLERPAANEIQTTDDGRQTTAVTFAMLLEMVALVSPELRVRFSTSHPKDITDEVLYTMKKYDNICKYIHLPAQSGSSRILELMNRTYDREWYMGKIDRIREILGEECGI